MATYTHPVTPAEISESILSICRELSTVEAPCYIRVQPTIGAAINECFPIVTDRVATSGGAVVYGWSIREQPKLFVEAEFHAVWRDKDGVLIDIAPKQRPTERILFAVDSVKTFIGRQVGSVRRPLSRTPSVIEFINVLDEEFEFMNRGSRASQQGDFGVRGHEATEYQDIQRRKTIHHLAMLKLSPEIWPYGPCACGSGKKVRWCHRSSN